ncbi:MAG: hypothetical protein GX617_06125 [Lentisphaerae bacterium]|nr:hypothetical protein [Lentisphaeria bacterium]NLE54494.1 hypothetical protein [Lentisphaerota bacterium]
MARELLVYFREVKTTALFWTGGSARRYQRLLEAVAAMLFRGQQAGVLSSMILPWTA